MSCGCRKHQSESDDIIYPKNSLLKYEPPRLIIYQDTSKTDSKKICRTTISPSFQPTSFYDENLNDNFDPYSQSCRSVDILDILFPPIEFINKTNHKYIICVSRRPATKSDVYNLEKTLNERLKTSRALEVGLCKYRRQIYDECFDELIRQITIECSERGLLLTRIRNTYRQMMNTYLNNYLSANAYAMRTLLINEQSKMKLHNEINNLEYDIEQLRKQLINAEDYFDNISKLYSKSQSSAQYRYQTISTNIPFELQQLRTNNQLLKQELENVLGKKLNFHLTEKLNKKNDEII